MIVKCVSPVRTATNIDYQFVIIKRPILHPIMCKVGCFIYAFKVGILIA